MRREHVSLEIALKCTKRELAQIAQNPFNRFTDTHDVRHRETFKVQRAHTETYKKSSVPFLQWKLNKQYKQITEQLSGAK